MLSEIVKTGYDGWVTVELYPYIDNPDAAGKEAKDFLEETIKELPSPFGRGAGGEG